MGCNGSKSANVLQSAADSSAGQAVMSSATTLITSTEPSEQTIMTQQMHMKMRHNEYRRQQLEQTRVDGGGASSLTGTTGQRNAGAAAQKPPPAANDDELFNDDSPLVAKVKEVLDKRKEKKAMKKEEQQRREAEAAEKEARRKQRRKERRRRAKSQRDDTASEDESLSSSSATTSQTTSESSHSRDVKGISSKKRTKNSSPRRETSASAKGKTEDASRDMGADDRSETAANVDSRGVLTGDQKESVRGRLVNQLGGANPHAAPVGASERSVVTVTKTPDDAADGSLSLDCVSGGGNAADLLRLKRERDELRAAVSRLEGELDTARTDLVYLRAAAEASDNFQSTQRIPPSWVPSEQQTIVETRRRLAEVESENVILKHRLRQVSSPSASQQRSEGAALLSPSELMARIHELQDEKARAEFAVQRAVAEAQQARAAAQGQVQQLEAEVLQARQRCDVAVQELAVHEANVVRAQKAHTELLSNISSAEAELAELTRQMATKAAAPQQRSTKNDDEVPQMVRQVARLLVCAESCPDDVRLQLLQFVCEHASLPIEGRPAIVTDPDVFDMNGVLYGDCLAFLACLVIQRPLNTVSMLILSETNMSDMGAAQLALTLAVLPFETPLSLINLSNNEITCRGAMQLLTAVGGPTSAKVVRRPLTLDLDNNPLYARIEDIVILQRQVEEIKKVTTLVTVHLPKPPKPEALLARSGSVFSVPPPAL